MKRSKRLVCFLLVLVMVTSLFPVMASAASSPAVLTNPRISPTLHSGMTYYGKYSGTVSNSSYFDIYWDSTESSFRLAIKVLDGEPNVGSFNESGEMLVNYTDSNRFTGKMWELSKSQMSAAAGKWIKVYLGTDYWNCHYYFKVAASGHNDLEDDDPADMQDPPNAPDIVVSAQSSSSIKVSWDRVTGADGYKIYRSTSTSTSSFKLVKTISSGSTTSWLDTGLEPDTRYYYKVKAYNAGGDSDYSNRDYDWTDEEETVESLSLSTENVSLTYNSGRATVTVTASGSWTVSDPEYNVSASAVKGYDYEWLTVSTSGNKLYLTPIRPNCAASARSAEVTVSCGSLSKTVTVTQAKCGEAAPTITISRANTVLSNGSSLGTYNAQTGDMEVSVKSTNVRRLVARLFNENGSQKYDEQILTLTGAANESSKIALDMSDCTESGKYKILIYASNSATANDYFSQSAFSGGFMTLYFTIVGDSPSSSSSYDADAALAYAIKYNGAHPNTAYNSAYTKYSGNDCANFASQCLAAGGLKTDEEWKPYSSAWVTCRPLITYLQNKGFTVYGYDSWTNNVGSKTRNIDISKIKPGDLIFCVNANGAVSGHVMIAERVSGSYVYYHAHTNNRCGCTSCGDRIYITSIQTHVALSEAAVTVCSHSWSNWTNSSSTQHKRTCSKCGEAQTGNHSWGAWSNYNTTNHKHTCSVCSTVTYAAHTWNSGVVTKEPTTTTTGIRTYTCTTCSATKTETIPVVECSHSWGAWGTMGTNQHQRACSKCGETQTESHTWGAWSSAGTSQHKHTCTKCQTTNYADHTWNSGVVTKEPTTTTSGTRTYTCTTCSATKTETIPPQECNHSWGAWGTMGTNQHERTCSKCGETQTESHTWGAWSSAGTSQHKHSCTKCQTTNYADHTWNNGVVTKEPTTTSTGIRTYTCTTCGETDTETIPRLEETDPEPPVYPDADAVIEAVTTTAKAGDTADVAIRLKDNPGIAYLNFKVEYDASAMTLQEVVCNGEFVESDFILGNTSNNPFNIVMTSFTADNANNGILLTLRFRINSDCEDGSYPICLTDVTGANINEEEVLFDAENGAVTVTSVIPGDVTGDGKFNGMDLIRLGKYFAGWDVAINKQGADVTGDGKVNGMDLIRLGKYFAGWDVQLGK